MNFIRPKIKLKLTALDVTINTLAFAGLLFIWVYTIVNYSQLPQTIPTHYNFSGKADGFGSKITIWVLPSIITFIAVGLSILNKYPHIFNYPFNLTKENAERQYFLATRLIRCLKLLIVVICILINVQTINSAHTGNNNIGWLFLPLVILILCLTIVVYLFKANKSKD